MNITRENTGELTATLKVEINADDYQPEVDKTLKEYQRKSNIPGFRPGKVPIGVVKKKYSKALIIDQVSKILNDSVSNYIKENNIDILGNPLPVKEKNDKNTFDDGQDKFEFYFDLGLAPDINLDVIDKMQMEYYRIKVDDNVIDRYVEDSRRRLGNIINPEISEEEDIVKGEFAELDESGNVKENGMKSKASFCPTYIKYETIKEKLIGVRKDDVFVINPMNVCDNIDEVARLLQVKKESVGNVKSDFQFTITEISRIIPAEKNDEFYSKVFPHENITNEEQLRQRISKETKISFDALSENRLVKDVYKQFLEKFNIRLPEDFMKRWFLENNEKEITKEQADKTFEMYEDGIKKQLINNRIIKQNNIEVKHEEVIACFQNYVAERYGLPENVDETITNQVNLIAEELMKNEEEVKRVYETLYEQKVITYIKSKIKIIEKEVSYEDFIKLATE